MVCLMLSATGYMAFQRLLFWQLFELDQVGGLQLWHQHQHLSQAVEVEEDVVPQAVEVEEDVVHQHLSQHEVEVEGDEGDVAEIDKCKCVMDWAAA